VAKDSLIHPVRDYFSSLEWDCEQRVLQWPVKYLGVKTTKENLAYVEAVGSRWLISAVARIMSPGAKADCCLILEGPQGLKKSSALRVLAGSEWFTDSIPSLEHKDSAIQLIGKLIVEFSELDRLSRSEVTLVKSYVSRAVDRFRPPFGIRAEDFGRQCIFAGTVNRAAYLADETGARRFWPLACGAIDIDALEADRDQIWAEAVALYLRGAVWWLDMAELNQQASVEQLDRYEGDPWEDPIREWVMDPVERLDQHGHPIGLFTSTRDSVTVSEVLVHCLGKTPLSVASARHESCRSLPASGRL
jgi:predicted P-loop ATPase